MSKKRTLLSMFAILVVALAVFAVPTVWLKPWSIGPLPEDPGLFRV